MFKKTYELAQAPAPAMAYADYAEAGMNALRGLLDAGICDESRFQEVLEQYPLLVPGTEPVIDAGQNGYHAGVITQPRLPGLVTKIPDFAVISWDSGTIYAALIELESPCKRWFTAGGQPTREFTQAMQQMRDWKIWFRNGLNVEQFRSYYRIPDYVWRGLELAVRCVLIFGRRAEIDEGQLGKKRQGHQQHDEVFMTWDRIAPNAGLHSALTVQLRDDGYHAVVVPPATTLGPADARRHECVRDKESVVLTEERIPEARRMFMSQRWPYWDDWVRTGEETAGVTLMSVLDCE